MFHPTKTAFYSNFNNGESLDPARSVWDLIFWDIHYQMYCYEVNSPLLERGKISANNDPLELGHSSLNDARHMLSGMAVVNDWFALSSG